MVRFFRSSFPVQFITIGVIGLLLWGTGAVHPPVMPPPEGPVPLYTLLYKWVSGFQYLAMAVGFFLVTFQALWLNYIVSCHDLVPNNSSLSALLFLLFISLFPSLLTLTPINITTLFLLFILKAVLESYNQTDPVEQVYTAGFFVGLSSLFYLPSMFFYGFLLICFLVYRSLKLREWISSLIGFATPFLYLVVIYFLTDHLPEFIALYIDFLKRPGFQTPEIPWNVLVLFGGFTVLALLGLWDAFLHIGEKTIELRKKSIVLLWMLFFSLSTVFYSNSLNLHITGLLCIPLAPFLANFYLRLRKPFWFELLLWLFLLALFANTAFTDIFSPA